MIQSPLVELVVLDGSVVVMPLVQIGHCLEQPAKKNICVGVWYWSGW